MKIIFNPAKPKGADIRNFAYKGKVVELHSAGEMKQYEDELAEGLVENYGFMRIVDSVEAKKISEKPKVGEFKCEYCDFSTNHKVALAGHMRSHKDVVKEKSEPQIDPNVVPVANVKEVVSRFVEEDDMPKVGVDKDGVEWYGDGLSEGIGSSMDVVPQAGMGHFKGGMLDD